MSTLSTLKRSAPYLLGAAALASAAYVWQKTRIGLPEGAVPVADLDIKRYAGEWYEIARFDHRFEKDLKNVTACYQLKQDSSFKVTNKGQNMKTGEWSQSTGKAKLVGGPNEGRLEVSFFGPFYAAYTIIAVDADYQHALVVGTDLEYLWMLSRTPEMPLEVRDAYLEKAVAIGYDTKRLIWTRHDG